jgi:serine/threonine-protein kinase
VIHRDLKPSNIMVSTHGQVYVMDWGIALLRDDERSTDMGRISQVRARGTSGITDTQPEALGSLTGTPAYMAPEQARGEIAHIDERTDVYGLGGILHFLLTRRAPHEAATNAESLLLARQERSIGPPPMLCRIATRALAFSPDDRYQTVEELKRDIEAFLRGGGWFAQQFFPAGTTIVREGDIAEAAYIVVGGTCELYKLGPVSGDDAPVPRFVCELGPGDVFGETAIFTSSTRTATIIAKSDVTVIVVTRAALERELDRSEWLRTFVRAVAQRFVELDRQLTHMTRDMVSPEPR